MAEASNKTRNTFIPARKSPLFIRVFSLYSRCLFRARFRHVWIKQLYFPSPKSRTIYYLNHSSWWDGLVPLLLAQELSLDNARAMMENKQMIRYRFFKLLGAFSVSPGLPGGALQALRYTVRFMSREGTSLFIYPEGRMVPFSTSKPDFRRGITWLSGQLPEVDLVPIGIYIHNLRYSRPELHIQIGKPVKSEPDDSVPAGVPKIEGFREELELAMQKQLQDLQRYGGFQDSYFRRSF